MAATVAKVDPATMAELATEHVLLATAAPVFLARPEITLRRRPSDRPECCLESRPMAKTEIPEGTATLAMTVGASPASAAPRHPWARRVELPMEFRAAAPAALAAVGQLEDQGGQAKAVEARLGFLPGGVR
jgi:hypothetical protein